MRYMKDVRHIFSIIINSIEYDVYDIEKKEHGGFNDTPSTWWVYYEQKLQKGVLPHKDDTNLIPYDSSINRRIWDISYKQSNHSKYKYGRYSFSSITSVEMRCNGKLVYSFGSYDYNYCVSKVGYLMVQLSEHPFDFFDPETENGRKIFWYGLPATIKVNNYEPWNIGIIPDYKDSLSKDEWWKEYKNRKTNITCNKKDDDDFGDDDEDFIEQMNSDYINWGDALSDGNIYWFR